MAQRDAAPSAAENLDSSDTIPGERRFVPRGASTGLEHAGRLTIDGSAGCTPLRLLQRIQIDIVLIELGASQEVRSDKWQDALPEDLLHALL